MDNFIKDGNFTQPFLVGLGNPKNPEEYFVYLDHSAVPAGTDATMAFDLLYKSFDVFNVDYPMYQFYTFFSTVVYGATKEISPQVRSFNIMLNQNQNQDEQLSWIQELWIP